MKTLRNHLFLLLCLGLCTPGAGAQTTLDIAEYRDNDTLVLPDDMDEWIVVGASLGSDYREEPLDMDSPGPFGVVQMEPNAYRYFLENGAYADGTMFLLTFYAANATSQPQLQGFVQGDMLLQEMHVIDAQRFTEGRGFYQFRSAAEGTADKIADASECISCHTQEGAHNGTFVQFYPVIRGIAENR